MDPTQPIQPTLSPNSQKTFPKLAVIIFSILLIAVGGFLAVQGASQKPSELAEKNMAANEEESDMPLEETANPELHPLSIEYLRKQNYQGSDIVIEETLAPGSNYDRYITSYQSDGNKIYALLTVPQGEKPATGWPVIIFNHGFIPPAEYRTTERYIAYTDAFSRNGYILFRSDYRGHGSSEGSASGGYGSNNYTIDVLNAVASVKRLKIPSADAGQLADPNRMGMWGHSMGGHITMRNMVVNKDIKAGVIWAGVVASYPDLLSKWRRTPPRPSPSRSSWRYQLTEQYGSPEKNPEFWNSISANSYLKDISGPLQIHHGTADDSVPVEFSENLQKEMEAAGMSSELFIYPGDDHNLANNLGVALTRSVEFFDKHLK